MSSFSNMRRLTRKYPAHLRPRGKLKKNEQHPIERWNIVTGDSVVVVNGPCTGERGKVLEVLRAKKRVVVEGVNMRLKHYKQRYWEHLGATQMKPASLHYSNVNLVCPVTNRPTRVRRGYLDDGTKVRIAKRSGAVIPKPQVFFKPKSNEVGELDTIEEDVLAVTFVPVEDLLALPVPSGKRPGDGLRVGEERAPFPWEIKKWEKIK